MTGTDDFGGISATAEEKQRSVAIVLLRAEFERLRLVITHASITQRKDFWGLLQAIAADDLKGIADDVEATRSKASKLWTSFCDLDAQLAALDAQINVSLDRIEKRLDNAEFRLEQIEKRTA